MVHNAKKTWETYAIHLLHSLCKITKSNINTNQNGRFQRILSALNSVFLVPWEKRKAGEISLQILHQLSSVEPYWSFSEGYTWPIQPSPLSHVSMQQRDVMMIPV